MRPSLVLAFFLCALPSWAGISTSWEKLESKENVDVYKGEVKDANGVVAFRGVSTIEAPIGHVLSVIYDTSRIKEWMSDVNDVKVIERTSKFEKIEYNRTDAPWPVSDRDFVYDTKVKLLKADKAVEILVNSVEHKDWPPQKGVVRGHLYQSRYFLRKDGEAKTYIEVEILADPKGSLPKWVVNLFQSAWPVNTVNGIRRLSTEKGAKVHPDIAEAIREFDHEVAKEDTPVKK